MQNLISKFNNPDTLGIISSYPSKSGEIARANAIGRYSYLLINSFPKNQKVVVFSEKKNAHSRPYLISENILVYPSFRVDDPMFFVEIAKSLLELPKVKDVLVQFEFSIYGGKKVIPGFLMLLGALKILGKNTSLVLHQVVSDLNDLSGHLGLSRGSYATKLFNMALAGFYSTVGQFANKIIVHDTLLKTRLSGYINEAKLAVIPHAIGDMQTKTITPALKSVARKSFDLKASDKVVGVYGYRSWYKGTDWIISTVHQLSLKYPGKHIKLLVAGGVSPTLKNTESYKTFDRKIKKVIKEADGSVVVTGFIPENSVWKVFAASDVMVFPYRTRMSASGAFSLTLAYKKPFLLSKPFSQGMELNLQNTVFDLNTFSFEQKLFKLLGSRGMSARVIGAGQKLGKNKSWATVSGLYLRAVRSARILVATKDAIEQSFIFSEA